MQLKNSYATNENGNKAPVNMSLVSYSKSCQFAPHGMNFIKPQMHLISSDLFSNHITFDKTIE